MKWTSKCFLLCAMFFCVFGSGPNEVITERPDKNLNEDDTSIQELHPPAAQTTAQTTRETNFMRDQDTLPEDSTTNPPRPTTVLHITLKTTEPSTVAPSTTPEPTEGKNVRGNFPKDLFSIEERKKGWVVLHIIGIFYMFVSLVILSEEFFVPALGVISDIFALSNNVAGATIVAGACSTPRFLAFFIGVFLSDRKLRIDRIISSAVFNILFVIGMCGLFAREMLHLSWWPLLRDMSFCVLDLVMLIIFFVDNVIVWWESLILIMAYCLYLILLKYDVQIERFLKGVCYRHRGTVIAMNEHGKETMGDGSDEASRNLNGSHKDVRHPNPNQEDPSDARLEMEEENQPLSLKWPGTWCGRVSYLLRLPVLLPLWISLPDVRKQKSRKFVVFTLLGSLLWMIVFLYILSWLTHQVADTVAISEVVRSYLWSVLNLPVLIVAVIVARRGLGDMATSVALGSNIYEITLSRPVPWLVFSAVYSLGPVDISSSGLTSAISEFSIVLLLFIISFAICKLKIGKILGFTMVLLYSLTVCLSVLLNHVIY